MLNLNLLFFSYFFFAFISLNVFLGAHGCCSVTILLTLQLQSFHYSSVAFESQIQKVHTQMRHSMSIKPWHGVGKLKMWQSNVELSKQFLNKDWKRICIIMNL